MIAIVGATLLSYFSQIQLKIIGLRSVGAKTNLVRTIRIVNKESQSAVVTLQ